MIKYKMKSVGLRGNIKKGSIVEMLYGPVSGMYLVTDEVKTDYALTEDLEQLKETKDES